MSALKLLKVMVQPVFVYEDEDGDLTEVTVPNAAAVTAKDWPTYATEVFPKQLAEMKTALDEGVASMEPPAPNRAARRKKPPRA